MPEWLWNGAAITFFVIVAYFAIVLVLIGIVYGLATVDYFFCGGRKRQAASIHADEVEGKFCDWPRDSHSRVCKEAQQELEKYPEPRWLSWIVKAVGIILFLWTTPLRLFG